MGISVYPSKVATPREQIFYSSGTWTYPTSSAFSGEVEVFAVGGGGAAGSYIHSNSFSGYMACATGGGGGGRVLTKKINVRGLGNQSVVVGAGGLAANTSVATDVVAQAGGASTFGNLVYTNMYPDPACSQGLFTITNTSVSTNYESYSPSVTAISPVQTSQYLGSVSPQYGAMTDVTVVGNDVGHVASRLFSVTPSTTFNFGFSFARSPNNSNSTTVIFLVNIYNALGQLIQQQTAAFNAPNSGAYTWTNVPISLALGSTASYAQFRWYSNSGVGGSIYFMVSGVYANPVSNTFTYGLTTGHEWSGVPGNSPTVQTNNASVIALGGGGGESGTFLASAIPNAIVGEPGWSAGGGAVVVNQTPGANIWFVGGCGGGSTTAATSPPAMGSQNNIVISRYYTSNNFYLSAFTRSLYNKVGGGGGGNALVYSVSFTGASAAPYTNVGANGLGENGYGYGGLGGFTSGGNHTALPFQVTGPINIPLPTVASKGNATTEWNFDAPANTGCGGNGIYGSATNSAQTIFQGGHGGSGIVIVRWYE